MQLDLGTQSIVAGALYDFLGHLTTLDQNLIVGSTKNPTKALDELVVWAHKRGLDIERAQVQDWNTQPGEVTIQMIASSGDAQQTRVMGALMDFAEYADLDGGKDREAVFMRWASKTGLTVSNPQPHWNFKQWA
jgi:hypothetical protein